MFSGFVGFVKFLFYVFLVVWLASQPVGQQAIAGIGGFFDDFYNNVLIYGNLQIYIIFCCFCFILGYSILRTI